MRRAEPDARRPLKSPFVSRLRAGTAAQHSSTREARGERRERGGEKVVSREGGGGGRRTQAQTQIEQNSTEQHRTELPRNLTAHRLLFLQQKPVSTVAPQRPAPSTQHCTTSPPQKKFNSSPATANRQPPIKVRGRGASAADLPQNKSPAGEAACRLRLFTPTTKQWSGRWLGRREKDRCENAQ